MNRIHLYMPQFAPSGDDGLEAGGGSTDGPADDGDAEPAPGGESYPGGPQVMGSSPGGPGVVVDQMVSESPKVWWCDEYAYYP